MSAPVCILTPTRNRAASFALTERWVAPQVRPGWEWVVVNDGAEPYTYTAGQRVIERRHESGRHSLCDNIAAGLAATEAEKVLVVEDDDWCGPGYLDALVGALDSADLAGFAPALYYRLDNRTWACCNNGGHCSLGMSGWRRGVFPLVGAIAALGKPWIDVALWQEAGRADLRRTFLPNTHRLGAERVMHVGLKGLKGEPGIGMGHRMQGKPDPGLRTLREWVGEEAAGAYAGM